MPGIGSLDKLQCLVTDNFSDAIRIQRHGQTVGNQVPQSHRQAALIPLANPVDQAIGFFRVDFAVTFGDQNALQKWHGLDHGTQQGCFAGSTFATDQKRLVRGTDVLEQRYGFRWEHADPCQLFKVVRNVAMLADADRRERRAAGRDGDIDAQAESLVCDPAMAVIVVDLATLADDQQAAVGVVRTFRIEPDRDGHALAMALDGEFGRTCPIDICHVRIIDIFLQRTIAKQEIHRLLAQFSGVVTRSQAFPVGRFLDQVLQNSPVDLASSNFGDQCGFRCQDTGGDLGNQVGQGWWIEIRMRGIIELDGSGAIRTVLFGEQGV